MKKLALPVLCVAFLAACTNNPKGDKAHTTDEISDTINVLGNTYNINAEHSVVRWTGSKVTGSHTGTVKIQSGHIVISDDNKLAGGDFTIDMHSILNEDLQGNDEYKNKLENHLKSDDFFAVETNPISTFKITEVKDATDQGAQVSGNLTLRGITKNISFPVEITSNTDKAFTANADFNINRKDWGVQYEGMKDDLIADEINFKITLSADK